MITAIEEGRNKRCVTNTRIKIAYLTYLFSVHASGYNQFRKSLNYSGISLDKVLYLMKDSFRLKGGNGLFPIEINK